MDKEIILLLGASSDIGCALIRDIAGDDNIILAHYNKSAGKLNTLISELGREIIPIQADLSDESQVSGLIGLIKGKYSFPTKIVHMPAVKYENIRFKDISWQRFQSDMDVQVKSIALILKGFLPLMSKSKFCKVVFVLSSCTINTPPKYVAHYVTAKYALLGLMKAIAIEYADKSVNINAISPSMMETRFLENIPSKILEINADANPSNRNATTGDVVPTIKFLLSRGSDYMTGANIPITGGNAF
jgi:3-oxoacyl-[acyl-carrier protein] reductase